MSIGLKKRLFWSRVTVPVLVFLVIFAGSSPFIVTPSANASSWAGWDGIDTIAILPTSDLYLNTAAQELQTYLGQMSGRSWTIVQGDVGGPAVRLDVDPDLPEFAGRSDESVQILADTDGIRITGKTPVATRHGAYVLLEKLGVRWFFKHPAWEVVPESLEDPGALNEIQEPSYFFRVIAPAMVYDASVTATWNMRNHLIGTSWYPSIHTYHNIIDISEYEAHPEWFIGNAPDSPWQLNPENPEVIDRAVQYARDQLSQLPYISYCNDPIEMGSACISPRDGGGFEPPYDEEDVQLITDKVYYLANEVAKVIKTEFPDKYVSLCSYFIYAGVPTYDLEPNLFPFLTTGYSLSDLSLGQRIEGLRARGAEVGIYDYLDVWVHYQDAPDVLLDHVKWLNWYASKGVRAVKIEAADGWAANGLSYYLIGKLLWNPNADVDALIDDFYTRAFGPAKQVMKHYYENRGTDDAALQASFQDLDQAESLAAGNDEILERIRHLEYYTRYLWLWHNKGITNLTLDELKDFYTFITKIEDLYVVSSRWVLSTYEDGLHTELENRGLTDSEIDALEDITPPTAAEARAWLDEGLAEFTGYFTPYINPREIDLQALGDTTEPRFPVMYGWYQDILVPSGGNETVDILVNGREGVVQWYDPRGLMVDYVRFEEGDLTDWTTISFSATIPGDYIIHTTLSRPIQSALYVDVPNRPASIIADPRTIIFQASEVEPRNAPSYWGAMPATEEYFYVPSGTVNFRFGASTNQAIWPAHGQLTDPNGITYPFSFGQQDGYSEEMTFDSPASGIWKIEISMAHKSGQFWLVGIPPLVWHDPEYLLVPAAESAPLPPILNPVGDKIAYVDSPFQLTVSAYDPNYDPLTFSASNLPPWASFDPVTRILSGIADQTGTYSDVHFEVSDGSLTDSENITITAVINQAPVLNAIGDKTVTEGQNLQFTISATDPYGDSLTYSASNLPSGATFSSTTHKFSWTPASGQAGSYPDVHFQVSDGILTTSEDITITVEALPYSPPPPLGGGGGGGGGGGFFNTAPICHPKEISTDEDAPLEITLSAFDAQDDALTYEIVTGPSNGSLSGTLPAITYAPNPNFNGSDSFTFTASDKTSTSKVAIVTITVNSINDIPVGEEQTVSTDAGIPVNVTLYASDADGDELTYVVIGVPSNGSLSGTPPVVTYTPDSGFSGSDTFVFTASDGVDTSEQTNIVINVNQLNGLPVAEGQNINTEEGTPVTVALIASDPDGDVLTYTVVEGPSNGTLSGTPPAVIYTPAPGFNGSDTFAFVASDGTDTSVLASIDITVTLADENILIVQDMDITDTDDSAPAPAFSTSFPIMFGMFSGDSSVYTYTPYSDLIASDISNRIDSDITDTSNPATLASVSNLERIALSISFNNGWNLGDFPVIFVVAPILLVITLAGFGYRHARATSRYRKPQLRLRSASGSVLNSHKR